MRQSWKALLGLLLGLVAIHGAAAAQGEAPYVYAIATSDRARPDKPADQIAAETAAASAAQAACEAGSMAGCAALGRAYHMGEGKPQSRPVAQLLYRQACNGAEASACHGLGELLRSAEGDAALRESEQAYVRGCRLGALEACDREADDLERGRLDSEPDPQAAEALRRATCAAGRAVTCRTLAGRLMGRDRSPEENEEGAALIDRQCRAGDPRACDDAADYWQRIEDQIGPRTIAYRELACAADDAWSCTFLGTRALRDGDRSAAARARALSYYDRACTLGSYHCETAAAIRDEPQLAARCAGGDVASCGTVGAFYAQDGGPLEDKPRALALLGPACEAAADPTIALKACELAAGRLLAQWDTSPDPVRLDAYMARACDAGSDGACQGLAEELGPDGRLPTDMPRALALHERLCAADFASSCRTLDRAIEEDPATPLMIAGDDYMPDLSDPDTAARLAAAREAENRAQEEFRAKQCTATSVAFRGTTYDDQLCDNIAGVIQGYAVRAGEAPWQALLWRPAVLGRTRLTLDQRVLCGGAVIRTGWVLTAAHCLIDEANGVKVPILSGGHRIRLGVSNPLADEGYSYPIKQVIQHPAFTLKPLAFDVALIEYDPRRGERIGQVFPIRGIALDRQPLAARPIRNRMPAFTYGWGRTALEGGAAPTQLQGARLELRDGDSCTRLTKFRGTLQDALLCAAGARGEQACFGDSGGPLITYGDAGQVPTVIGVVSGGVECGRTGVPSRFTRLGHPRVQKWLNDVLPPASQR